MKIPDSFNLINDPFKKMLQNVNSQASQIHKMLKNSVADELLRHHQQYDFRALFEQNNIQNVNQILGAYGQMPSAVDALSSLSSCIGKVGDDATNQISQWHKLLTNTPRMTDPNLIVGQDYYEYASAWNTGFFHSVNKIKENGLLEMSDLHSSRLLEPYRVFSDFVDSTFQLEVMAKTVRERVALNASVALFEGQLFSGMKLFDQIVALPDVLDPISPARPLNLPYVQQEELLERSEELELEDESSFVWNLPSSDFFSKSEEILKLIVICNEMASSKPQGQIFKPTTRLMEVYVDLPLIVSIDKDSFGKVVDCLYFLFYESPGADNLRYLSKNGGVLSGQECEFVWDVKNFRNKWLRHDPDHGSDGSILKKREDLLITLKRYGISVLPSSREEFMRLHILLVEEAYSFLKNLSEKMKA